MKILIADISSFCSNGIPVGHWLKTSIMYATFLKENGHEVTIAGSKEYLDKVKPYTFLELPYSNIGIRTLTKKETVLKILRELQNIKVINGRKNYDIIIYQSSGFFSLLLYNIFTLNRSKKYVIQYSDARNSLIKKFLFKISKRKYSGLITTSEMVGKKYNIPYTVISDYLYNECFYNDNNEDIEYDFSVLGTMNPQKNIEDVVSSFNNTNYKVLIAGAFRDVARFDRLSAEASDNIILINKYLSENEYMEYIAKSKWCILPYSTVYDDTSSGVVYDYIFSRKPVIASNRVAFSFIKDEGIGIVYEGSIKGIVEKIAIETEGYVIYKKAIDSFIDRIKESEKALLGFLVGGNIDE